MKGTIDWAILSWNGLDYVIVKNNLKTQWLKAIKLYLLHHLHVQPRSAGTLAHYGNSVF